LQRHFSNCRVCTPATVDCAFRGYSRLCSQSGGSLGK